MPIEITFLGSGDAFSSGGKMHTCILVKSIKRNFLIDCGASAMIGIKRFEVDPNDIDLILISHLHGDHFGGIPFFILDAQLVSKRTTPLTIAGPIGTKDRILEAMEVLFRGSSKTKRKFNIKIVELSVESPNVFTDVSVTPYPVIHPSGDPSLALRVDHLGKTIAYTGDTEWTDELIPACQNAHLLISECYTYNKKIKFHLDYETLTSHLSELNPKRLILTHMGEEILNRSDLAYEYAEDGLMIKI